MVGSRTWTLLAGLAASLLVSYLAWRYLHTFVLFFFLPFVPFLFRNRSGDERPPEKVCPTCRFRTREREFTHCPYDGTELEARRRD